jgi:MYND finger
VGVGQPPHYHVNDKVGVVYRLSPLAKCPCINNFWTHCACCWKDTASPTYLVDVTGRHMYKFDALVGSTTIPAGTSAMDMAAQYTALLRSDPDALKTGTPARGSSPEVYAGCLERLADDDVFFLWKDLHWMVDESELLRRAQAWNKALQEYCRDKEFEGEELAQVIAKHRANPCAPCGRIGCNAFEKEPKEFRRYSRCKLISYCCQECQKLDWSEHRKGCRALGTK